MINLEKLELWDEANVRKNMSPLKLQELADNIKHNGLMVPLLVKHDKKTGKYLVFSGQRRLAACQRIEKPKIECFVIEKITEDDARLLSLSENLYREKMATDEVAKAAYALFKKNNKNYAKTSRILGVHPNTLRGYLDYYAVPESIKKIGIEFGLKKNDITKIFNKFRNTSKCLGIIRELGQIESRKEKKEMRAAIREATPTDSVDKIKKRTKQLLNSTRVTIIIPNDVVSEINKEARQQNQDISETIQDIVEDWAKGYA